MIGLDAEFLGLIRLSDLVCLGINFPVSCLRVWWVYTRLCLFCGWQRKESWRPNNHQIGRLQLNHSAFRTALHLNDLLSITSSLSGFFFFPQKNDPFSPMKIVQGVAFLLQVVLEAGLLTVLLLSVNLDSPFWCPTLFFHFSLPSAQFLSYWGILWTKPACLSSDLHVSEWALLTTPLLSLTNNF